MLLYPTSVSRTVAGSCKVQGVAVVVFVVQLRKAAYYAGARERLDASPPPETKRRTRPLILLVIGIVFRDQG